MSKECFAWLVEEVRSTNFMGTVNVNGVEKPSYLLHPERLEHDIAATLAVLRLSNNYSAMAPLLGCGRNTLSKTVERVICVLTPIMKKEISFARELIDHHCNRADGWLFPGKRVAVSTDTFPLTSWSFTKSNQPKYAGDVVKIIATTTNTGFFCSVGSALYTGASSDQVIMDRERLLDKLREENIITLADGVFTARDAVIVPHRQDTIKAAVRESPQQGEAMLRHNAAIQVLRSRTEHCYSRVQFGRWRGLHRWDHHDSLLWGAVQICAGLLNKEMYLRHGPAGRYGPLMHCQKKQAYALQEIRAHEVYNSRFKMRAIRLTDEEEDRLCGATYNRGVCEGSLFVVTANTVMNEAKPWDVRKKAGQFLLQYFNVRSAREVQALQAQYPEAFAP